MKNGKEGILIFPVSSELEIDKLLSAASKIQNMQIFDANSITSEKHLELAFFHAEEAFRENSNITKSLKMEFLLHTAATRQITVAIKRCGIKDPKKILLATWGNDRKNKNEILKILQSKEAKWRTNPAKIVSLYELDKKRKTSIEDQVIEKMVEVQVGD